MKLWRSLDGPKPNKTWKRPPKSLQNTPNYPYFPMGRSGIGHFSLFLFPRGSDWILQFWSISVHWRMLKNYLRGYSCPIREYIYLIIVIILIFRLVKSLFALKNKFNSHSFWADSLNFGKKLLMKLLQLYVVFMLLWGLNYRKSSPAQSFHLSIDTSYSEVQLDSLSLQLIDQLNATRQNLPDSVIASLNYKQVFDHTLKEYKEIQNSYSFLQLEKPVLKKAQFPSWETIWAIWHFTNPWRGSHY